MTDKKEAAIFAMNDFIGHLRYMDVYTTVKANIVNEVTVLSETETSHCEMVEQSVCTCITVSGSV